MTIFNWGRNFELGHVSHYPEEWAQVQQLVSNQTCRVIGGAHSFWYPDCSIPTNISLAELPIHMEVDSLTMKIRVEGNPTLGTLAIWADQQGLALPYLPSSLNFSLAGALQTWTHGSGIQAASLGAQVTDIEMITPTGPLSSSGNGISPDVLLGTVGTIGVVKSVELQLEKQFLVKQTMYREIDFNDVIARPELFRNLGYSVSVFLDVRNGRTKGVLVKDKETGHLSTSAHDSSQADGISREGFFPGGSSASNHSTFSDGLQLSHLSLPHFVHGCLPEPGSELQVETFFSVPSARIFLQALCSIDSRFLEIISTVEIRYSGGDNILLGGSQGDSVVCIHLALRPRYQDLPEFLSLLTSMTIANQGRPHLGKLFGYSDISDWLRFFPRFSEYLELKKELDPKERLPRLG